MNISNECIEQLVSVCHNSIFNYCARKGYNTDWLYDWALRVKVKMETSADWLEFLSPIAYNLDEEIPVLFRTEMGKEAVNTILSEGNYSDEERTFCETYILSLDTETISNIVANDVRIINEVCESINFLAMTKFKRTILPPYRRELFVDFIEDNYGVLSEGYEARVGKYVDFSIIPINTDEDFNIKFRFSFEFLNGQGCFCLRASDEHKSIILTGDDIDEFSAHSLELLAVHFNCMSRLSGKGKDYYIWMYDDEPIKNL